MESTEDSFLLCPIHLIPLPCPMCDAADEEEEVK